nr:uncharacterized protein C1orf141 homolog [Loxodonta africana]
MVPENMNKELTRPYNIEGRGAQPRVKGLIPQLSCLSRLKKKLNTLFFYSQEQNYINPIIFHETGYVQMLLLTKNKFPLHPMGNENIYPYKRTHFVLTSGQSINPSNLKRTVPTAWRKNIQTTPFEVKCRVVEDKPKRKNNKPILENINWNKLYHFSQTFSSLTKKFVGFLDKTVIQERNAKTGKFERMFSTTKPMNSHKFNASTVSSCSKPLKNLLKVHKLNNITPLDDLLNLSSKT